MIFFIRYWRWLLLAALVLAINGFLLSWYLRGQTIRRLHDAYNQQAAQLHIAKNISDQIKKENDDHAEENFYRGTVAIHHFINQLQSAAGQ